MFYSLYFYSTSLFFSIAGDASTAEFQHWGPGFPKGGDTMNCAAIEVGDTTSATDPQGFWADVDCTTDKIRAICEQPRA